MGASPCVMVKYFTYRNYSLILKNDTFYWTYGNITEKGNFKGIQVSVVIEPLNAKHINEPHIDLFYPQGVFFYATFPIRCTVKFLWFWEKIFHLH